MDAKDYLFGMNWIEQFRCIRSLPISLSHTDNPAVSIAVASWHRGNVPFRVWDKRLMDANVYYRRNIAAL